MNEKQFADRVDSLTDLGVYLNKKRAPKYVFEALSMQVKQLHDLEDEVARLQAENAQLRDALQEICNTKIWNGGRSWQGIVDYWLRIARKALADQP